MQYFLLLGIKNLDMRKLLICLAIATVAVSCKKVQAGGNKNALKLEEGVERYSDDKQVGEIEGAHHEATADHAEATTVEAPKTDSTATAEAPTAEH